MSARDSTVALWDSRLTCAAGHCGLVECLNGPCDAGGAPDANDAGADTSVCTFGHDETCNDNLAISSLHGQCLPDGSCSCSIGPGLKLATGKCR